jgi:hypothetical protein
LVEKAVLLEVRVMRRNRDHKRAAFACCKGPTVAVISSGALQKNRTALEK